MMKLAIYPNIKVKLGGLGMKVCGSKFHLNSLPPNSDQLCDHWKPWFYEAIELFGVERCMFESNFPVDKGSFDYGVMWNAYKKITQEFSYDEKNKLFFQNAKYTYKVDLT